MTENYQELKDYIKERADLHDHQAEVFRTEVKTRLDTSDNKYESFKNNYVLKELYEKDCKSNDEFRATVKSRVKRALQIILGIILAAIIYLIIKQPGS